MHGGGGLETETQLGKGLWRLGLLQRQLEMCDVFERPQRRDWKAEGGGQEKEERIWAKGTRRHVHNIKMGKWGGGMVSGWEDSSWRKDADPFSIYCHLLYDKLWAVGTGESSEIGKAQIPPSKSKMLSVYYQHLYYPNLHHESPRMLQNATFPKLIRPFKEQKHSSSCQLLSVRCMPGAFPAAGLSGHL